MSESTSPFISVVSPVYGAANLVDLLVANISQVLQTITSSYEIILVDDGSPDAAWTKIEQNAHRLPRVKGIKLSRNFGQHQAIMAGLKYSTGKWVVVMDCDLQDNPLEFPRMFQKAQEGYKIVLAQRNNKKHNSLIIFLSQIFNRILSYLTGTTFDSRIGNFGLYHREVITTICQMPESMHYFPLMVQKAKIERAILATEHQKRPLGSSSYSLVKKLKLAFKVLSSYSSKLLKLTIRLGTILALVAVSTTLLYFIFIPFNSLTTLGAIFNFVSIGFWAGFVLFLPGIMGLYLAKITTGTKKQPLYRIEEKVNFEPGL
ncbi:glycosyltransferase [Adhaeribacter arboris]|uniref:Glycosyltransferase n=1 Tax=Adhaeribacter arboris TaxID=2072846 RepID=A0A2T2YFL6_9BACT|nr:glycosyltransferase family 2 protein [Adhaeribacter arboris]PSR54300.1 glycosyltransferase [Adhaeribacter arboris]